MTTDGTAAEQLATALASAEPELDRCLLLVSEAMGRDGALSRGLTTLDGLAAGVTDPTLEGVIRHLFGEERFAGDVADYHAEDNSFLDLVLERRLGMPITLSAVLMAVGARVGVGLHGVALPGHFLVGVDDDGPELRFVDAFAGGVVLDLPAAIAQHRRRFGADVDADPAMWAPADVPSIVARVLNNLVRTYSERDPTMLDRLLDLRVRLPGPPEERMLLVRLAESRARWSLAAELREQLDPDDPHALRLRARLN